MGKKFESAAAKIGEKPYGLKEAVEAVKKSTFVKFDETVDIALRLGVYPKRADQMVRGTTSRPRGRRGSAGSVSNTSP